MYKIKIVYYIYKIVKIYIYNSKNIEKSIKNKIIDKCKYLQHNMYIYILNIYYILIHTYHIDFICYKIYIY